MIKIRKLSDFSVNFLIFLSSFYPIGIIVSAILGYKFEIVMLKNTFILASIDIICILLIILTYKQKIKFESKAIQMFFSLFTLITVINTSIFMLRGQALQIELDFYCSMINIICAFILSKKQGREDYFNKAFMIFSAGIIPLISFFIFIILAFDDVEPKLIKTVISPDRAYYAEVLDDIARDGTLVNVYENKGLDLVAIKIYKEPKTVYDNEGRYTEKMNVYWKNSECLVINSMEYSVN